MKLGLHVPRMSFLDETCDAGATLTEVARAAEAAGFDRISFMDHLRQIPNHGQSADTLLECMTALSFVAGVTKRIKLAPMAICALFRHPYLLAKEIASLQLLSGGRVTLGIGAGWFATEAEEVGMPFPVHHERVEIVDETIQICRQVWRGEDRPFQGKHFKLSRTAASPCLKSVGAPHVIVGGSSPSILGVAAARADGVNLPSGGPYGPRIDYLHRQRKALGLSDPFEISAMYPIRLDETIDLDDIVSDLNLMASAGVDVAICRVDPLPSPRLLAIIQNDIMPALAS